MKLKRFESRIASNVDDVEDAEPPFKLSFSKPTNADANCFSVLIGSNGTRKSRTLRDILDLSMLRSRDEGSTHEGKLGKIEFWRHARSPVRGISKVLAISGVATDRFPSRLAPRRGQARSLTYAYVGPRSENNLVSRAQSINQIARSLLERPDRIRARHKQLRNAFSLLQTSNGILFRLQPPPVSPMKKTWTAAALRKLIEEAQTYDLDLSDTSEIVRRGVAILRRHELIEVRLDLDDGARIDSTPDDLPTLSLLMTVGALNVAESYVLTADDRKLHLSEFSSGQWQILASLLFAAVAIEDDALVLIDEPENSLHPAWQQQYLPLLQGAITSARGAHVLVATHSPLVAASLDPESAEVFQIRPVDYGLAAHKLNCGPFGWSADQILQEVFGLHSARSAAFTEMMEGALKLMAKGDRSDPRLIGFVDSLRATLPSLPDDDYAREIIASLVSIVKAPAKRG